MIILTIWLVVIITSFSLALRYSVFSDTHLVFLSSTQEAYGQRLPAEVHGQLGPREDQKLPDGAAGK